MFIILYYLFLDVDECHEQIHACVHGSCNNTDGNYTCNCQDGYEGQCCDQGWFIVIIIKLRPCLSSRFSPCKNKNKTLGNFKSSSIHGVMNNVHASNAVDRGFVPRSG